jgi:phosphoserine phosphatase RsbU/P
MELLLLEQQCDASLESVRSLRSLLEQVTLSTITDKSLRNKIILCLSESATNIVKHSSPKATQIQVRFRQKSQYWMLEIIDDGGLYDPLSNTDGLPGQSAEAESGRGIALLHANCQQIGYLPYNSNQNCIILCWPVDTASTREKILLVEDDASMRRLYKALLKGSYDVFLAENGLEALEVLKRQDINLVLSDIKMPSMDGLDLRSELIQHPDYELIPFIFMTANINLEMQGRAASLGIDDYIVKPASQDMLVNTIERVLQRTRQIINQLSNRLSLKITDSFIPKLPKALNQWNIAVANRNTGTGGGDLLLHQTDSERSTIALIDTMGHDESAKFFAYAYGGMISGLMRSGGQNECHQLLAQISNLAYDDEMLSKITLTGIVLNLSNNGEISIASAGHPYPLLISQQQVTAVEVGGMLPGLLADTQYQPVQFRLNQRDRMAFFTDGLFESAANNEARKVLEEEVMSLMAQTSDMPIDRACRLIMQKFDEIAGSPALDDTTLVLIETNS